MKDDFVYDQNPASMTDADATARRRGAPPLPEQAETSAPDFESMAEASVVATALESDEPVSKRRASDDRKRDIILNGPIARGVFTLAFPSVATMLLQTTNGMLDRSFVGRLGPEALAAITVSSSLMFALMSGATAVSVGTTALVARFVGENKIADAVIVVRQSLLIGLCLSVLVGGVMLALRDPLLTVLGLSAQAHVLAARYLTITCLGLPSLFLMLMLNGAFRGMGDTVRPLWVTVGAIAIHSGFDYLLIFGNFGFPKMGLPGGALALALSQTMSTVLYVIFLRGTRLAAVWRTGDGSSWRLDTEWVRRICRIGLPASVQQLIRVGSMLAFQSVLTRTADGSAAVAALGVGLVSESIAFMPGFGYAIAASAFVGQNLGAKQIARANAGAWIATYQAIAVMSVMGGIFYAAASPFAHHFLPHNLPESPADYQKVEATIRLTIAYLRIAAWAEPFLALGMVLVGALQGAGETVGPTVLTVITMIFLRIPLAYILLKHTSLGTTGAWLAMSISTTILGLLTVVLFRRGRWRTIRV